MATRQRIKPVRTDQPDAGYPQSDADRQDPARDVGTVYGPVNIPVGAKTAELLIVVEGNSTIVDAPPTTTIFYAIDIDDTGAGAWRRRTWSEAQGSNGVPPRFPHAISVDFSAQDIGKPIRAVISNNARVRFGIDAGFYDADGVLMDVF